MIKINGSNTGIVLGNDVSEESAKECFSRLTFSVEASTPNTQDKEPEASASKPQDEEPETSVPEESYDLVYDMTNYELFSDIFEEKPVAD